nr:AAA family ATPase [Nocardiopsis mwathae]
MIVLGGVPGAGKSTLLRRLYGLEGTETRTSVTHDGVRIVDSQASRNRLTPWLRRVPYPAWRWAVHLLHVARVLLALRMGGPVIVHETATRGPVRWLLGWYCRLVGVGVHLVLIDVSPDEALSGQEARRRRVSARSNRAHTRRWRRLLAACARGPGAAVPGAVSLVLVDREGVARLSGIEFTAALVGTPRRE